jgi:glycosyltransferase involved in cell wall biosynthesis
MKIAYVTLSPIPSTAANSVHVMKMCDAFAGLGHEVVLYCPRRPEAGTGDADPFAFYGLRNRFQIRRRPLPGGRLGPYLFAASVALGARAEKVGYLHGRSLHACYFAALLGVPVVYEAHTFLAGRRSRAMLKRLAANPACLYVVTTSETLRSDFQAAALLPPEKMRVAYNGADVQDGGEDAAPSATGRLRVGYLGHLYPGKGMDMVAELAKRCGWADFHVVGGQPDDVAGWEARTAGMGNLRLYGHLPHPRAAAIRGGMDVLLAPYQERVAVAGGAVQSGRWMTPIKLFEYMAAGKAIVASDLPVAREVLEHGTHALLCPPDDAEAWQRTLETLRDDPELRARLGARARNELVEKYSWRTRAGNLVRAAETALG